MHFLLTFVFSLSICASLATFSAANPLSPPTLLFIPFDVKDAGSYRYLRDAGANMLAARVAAKTEVVIQQSSLLTNDSPLTAAQIQQHLNATDADYLIVGALQGGSGGVRIKVTVYPAKQEQTTTTLSAIANNSNEILATFDQLATDITQSGLQLNAGTKVPQVEAKIITSMPLPTLFQTPHPDRHLHDKTTAQTPKRSPGHPLSNTSPIVQQVQEKLPFILQTFTVGDLDQDGIEEIIVAHSQGLNFYHAKQTSINRFAQLTLPSDYKFLRLYVATTEQNTPPKLYLSAERNGQASSLIVRLNKMKKAEILQQGIPYYLRPFKTEKGQVLLLGQKRGNQGKLSPITQLQQEGDQFLEATPFPLPATTDIFSFTQANFTNQAGWETVCLSPAGRLQLFSHQGVRLWQSQTRFGESKTYLGPNLIDRPDSDSSPLQYIALPLIASHPDQNGQQTLIISQSERASPLILSNSRFLNNTRIVALNWDGQAMVSLWHTEATDNTLKGYHLYHPTSPDDLSKPRLITAHLLDDAPFRLFYRRDTHTALRLNTLQPSSKKDK